MVQKMRTQVPTRRGEGGEGGDTRNQGRVTRTHKDVKGAQSGDGMLEKVASWRALCWGLGT